MKIKGTGADGKDVEIEVKDGMFLSPDDVNRDYVSRQAHDTEFARYRERYKDAKTPDQLLDDEDFRKKATEKWGLKPERLTKDQEAQLTALREEITAKLVNPLQEELKERDSKIKSLLDRRLESDLIDAARRAGVAEGLLTRQNGRPAPITAFFDGVLGYDPDSDEFFQYDPKNERFVISANAGKQGASQYVTIPEVVQGWAKDKSNAMFLQPTRQKGPNFQGAGESSGSPSVIDGADARAFGSNLEKIARGEVKVRVAGVESGV